jgi:segregation and condensation protein A
MTEKKLPWWRRALSFALHGIRSGFGLLQRNAISDAEDNAGFQRPSAGELENTKENADAKENEELTRPTIDLELIAAELAAMPEPPPMGHAVPVVEHADAPMAEAVEAAGRATMQSAVLPVRAPDADSADDARVAANVPEELPQVTREPQSSYRLIEEAAQEAMGKPSPNASQDSSIEFASDAEPAPVPDAAEELTPVLDIESVPAPETAIVQEPDPIEALEAAPVIQPAVEQTDPATAVTLTAANEPEGQPVEEPTPQAGMEPEAATHTIPEGAKEAVHAVPAEEPELAAIDLRGTGEEPEHAAELAAVDAQFAEFTPAPTQAVVREPIPESADRNAAQVEAQAEPPTHPRMEPAPEPESAPPAVQTVATVAAPPSAVDARAAARLAAQKKKIEEADEQSPFSVFVGQVYDGPLDLLLDLIRKQDIDIYDIPIAKITSQFLAYVNRLKASDVDVAGEFIYMASLLIHIKSRMLLPRAPAGPEDTPEDPRHELVERLLEHERFKNAAQMLQQKQMLEAASWSNPGAQEFKEEVEAEPEIAADTVDLVRIFRDILERARTRPTIDITEDSVTVGQMIQFLARRLTMEDKPVALRRLLSHTRSERALIAMFLALLELVRLQAILLRQDRHFSEIFIKKQESWDAVMTDGLVNARDDWR